MLLNEILLYPGIATVVGLELDQKVVRMAFKYLDKVEWWFGDDTKSLLMLPKVYFGSFDMMLGKWGIGARVPPVGKQPNSNNRILSHPRHNWDLPVIGGPQDIGFDSSLMTIGGIQHSTYSFFRDGYFTTKPSEITFWEEGHHKSPNGISVIFKGGEGGV